MLDDISDSKINIGLFDRYKTYTFYFFVNRSDNNMFFYWDDIKDSFIPFLEIFMSENSIVDVHLRNTKKDEVEINAAHGNGVSPYISFITIDSGRQGPTLSCSLESVLDNVMEDCVKNINGVCERVKIKMIYFYFKVKE